MQRFSNMPDETVVKLAQDFDADALEYILVKYKSLIRTKARSYFLIGADREDIVQEGMIGLYKAIRDFKDDKQASFRAFAELCVTPSDYNGDKKRNPPEASAAEFLCFAEPAGI